jgi:subtilase family serine protease
MQWSRFQKFLFAVPLVVTCCLVFSKEARAATQVLKGHVRPVTKNLKPLRRLESTTRLDLAIGLPLRNPEKLTNLLEKLYSPTDANFRHYLKPDEFTDAFGPSEADYQSVVDFAKSHGLEVKHTHGNRTLLDVSGSVTDIENAFHIHMHVYQHPTEARTFFAPDVEPSLDLDTPVLMISGLDSYVRPRPQIHRVPQTLEPTIPLGGGGGGSKGGGYAGPFFGTDFRSAYASGVAQDGAGQSVGLFELSGYYPGDIASFEDEVNFSTSTIVTNILIDAFDGDDTNMDYAIEVTSDIEMAISMAPGLSSVLVYEGPTPMDVAPIETNYVQPATTTAQINDVLNRMATDDKANQLSCSYEMDIDLSTIQIFQQFAAQGQSFFTGSGDFGAYPGAIDEPADDPYVTVVGGTTMTMNTEGGSWSSEVVWLTPASDDGDLLGLPDTPEYASGGGVSLAYASPSWQQGISMSGNQGSTTMRNIPDVAAVANNINIVWGNDPYYAGNIYVELNDLLGAGDDYTEGGTSLATPLWAGFMALVNQKAAANGQPPVGFANPALYAIAKSTNYQSCFHDVISGNNYNAGTGSPNKYKAAAGYDLCTGWGTIIGSKLMAALLAPPAEHLIIDPPTGFLYSGPGGKPIKVATETFSLTNTGTTPLQWSVLNTSLWLTVSSTGGTLASQANTSLTVSINSAVTNYLIGQFSGNIVISNQTDGTYQNREFDLYVGNGGFETGDFTYWQMTGDTNLVFALAGDDVDVGGTNALASWPDDLFVHSGLYGAYLGEWNWEGDPDIGTLSQTVATIPGQPYIVSFWLTSVSDKDGDTTPNYFAAKWNGSTLYEGTNLPAFGWTNIQYTVPATNGITTLEFDFNNVPGAFAIDDVSVQLNPAPVLQAVQLITGNISFAWTGSTNYTYELQFTTSLSNPNWTTVIGGITTNNGVMSVLQPVNNTSVQEYYRVIETPVQ